MTSGPAVFQYKQDNVSAVQLGEAAAKGAVLAPGCFWESV